MLTVWDSPVQSQRLECRYMRCVPGVEPPPQCRCCLTRGELLLQQHPHSHPWCFSLQVGPHELLPCVLVGVQQCCHHLPLHSCHMCLHIHAVLYPPAWPVGWPPAELGAITQLSVVCVADAPQPQQEC